MPFNWITNSEPTNQIQLHTQNKNRKDTLHPIQLNAVSNIFSNPPDAMDCNFNENYLYSRMELAQYLCVIPVDFVTRKNVLKKSGRKSGTLRIEFILQLETSFFSCCFYNAIKVDFLFLSSFSFLINATLEC